MLSTLERPDIVDVDVGMPPEAPVRPTNPTRSRSRSRTRTAPPRVPRVPKGTLKALRADLVSVGLSVQHAARLLNVNRLTLESLLAGRQHVYSRLGYAAWPERVQALCDQMRQSNTILARHLDAAAHEIAASGLPLPALVGGTGPRSRSGRRTAAIGKSYSNSSSSSSRKAS